MQDIQPDIHQALARLRRPPLLVRAARLGASGYKRGAALPRLLGAGPVPPVRAALARLIEAEAAQDAARRAGAINYRAADHVALLIAVMGEAQLLDAEPRAATSPVQENASGIASLRVAT
ncbi:MAG: DUF6477 family protein [Roseovarius sp.]|nr:DUF6477 family protein [Roseovarius sp.]MDZ7710553.1 DUF6477 family protein [Roseovarius sp.]